MERALGLVGWIGGEGEDFIANEGGLDPRDVAWMPSDLGGADGGDWLEGERSVGGGHGPIRARDFRCAFPLSRFVSRWTRETKSQIWEPREVYFCPSNVTQVQLCVLV